MTREIAIIRGSSQFLLIGQVLLLNFILSGVVDTGAFVRASETPQCVIATSGGGNLLSDEFADAYTGSVASWRHPHTKLFAKGPKAHSTLPCAEWVLVTPTPVTPFHLRAGLPLHALAATQCYAIHPRPPSSLPA